MLIVIGTTDSLWNKFHSQTGLPNDLPDWWHHILVPWPFDSSSLQSPAYRWGVSSLYYWDSNGRLKIAGELFADSVIILPADSFQSGTPFSQANRFARMLLEAIDPYVDFSLYDRNNDGKVDPGAITFITPFLNWGWANPDFNDTTDEGIVLTGGLDGGATIVGYGSNLRLVFEDDTTPRNDPTQEIPRARFQNNIAHEYGHHLGLPDKYDPGTGDHGEICVVSNPHSKSSGVGGYSLMTPLKPRPSVDGPRPLSLWDRWLIQDIYNYGEWIVLSPRVSLVNLTIPDYFSGGVMYRIPIPGTKQAFLFTAYFRNDSTFARIFQSSGLFIQHIRDTSIRFVYIREDQEKNKIEDNELAIGQWDTAGVAVNNSTEDPVWGYDLHDIGIAGWGYVPQGFGGFVARHVIDHNPRYSALSPYDFFNDVSQYYGVRRTFSTFSNPSSDGYVYRPGSASITRYDSFPPGTLVDTVAGDYWGCTEFLYPGYSEFNVAQLLASHILIRNIETHSGSRTVTADVYTNFIQTDSVGALGLPHEKRLVAEGPAFLSRVGLLYQARGYLYATLSYAGPDDLGWLWEAGFPVDSGVTQASGVFIPYTPPPPMFCVGYVKNGTVLQQCRFTSSLFSWIRPYLTVYAGTLQAQSHSMAATDTVLHHAVLLWDPVQNRTVIRRFLAGPATLLQEEDVVSWSGHETGTLDVAARSREDFVIVYTRGSAVHAAWKTGGGFRTSLLGTGTTPLVDTLPGGGYGVVWQDGDTIRYRTFTNGDWSPAYGLTVGELLALEGGVLLYRRLQPYNALPDGVLKRVWDASNGGWGVETFVMDPVNKEGFHIAPAGAGKLRMVFVIPTGWNDAGDPPYRVVDYAELDINQNPYEGEVRGVPALVVKGMGKVLEVQVGSGIPARFELLDGLGRRVAVVEDGLRARFETPRPGLYVIRVVLPDGRVAKQKVMVVR